MSNSSNIAGQNTNLESETDVPELPLLEGVQKTNVVLDFGDLPQYPNISEIESFVAKGPQTIYPEEIPNDGKTAFPRIYVLHTKTKNGEFRLRDWLTWGKKNNLYTAFRVGC